MGSRIWFIRLSAGILTCLLLIVIIEIFGASLALIRAREVVYFRTPPEISYNAKGTRHETKLKHQQTIHPYWGFSGQSEAVLADGRFTNRFGFIETSDRPIPFNKNDSDFVVAVFGGSVAANLVLGSVGGMPLQAALEEQEAFHGKNIIVINMAQGAGKQPQQLLELSYLLSIGQKVDIVLNVDGYNDFALSYLNTFAGLSPTMPSSLLILPLSDSMQDASQKNLNYYEYMADLIRAKARNKQALADLGTAGTGLEYIYATIVNSVTSKDVARLTAGYAAVISKYMKNSQAISLEWIEKSGIKDEDVFDNLFSHWRDSSRLMGAVSAAVGAKYVHVVQPNQYFSNRKFDETERLIAIPLPPDDPTVRSLRAGYTKITDSLGELEQLGITSAIDIMDGQAEHMYRDTCCHYTAAGETVLARFVAAQVAKQVERISGR